MNLFKKIVSGTAIAAVAVSTVSPAALAYTNAQLDAANQLASMGIIVDHTNDPSGYNMDQTVLRQEIAAVARGAYEVVNDMTVGSAKTTTCDGRFSDVSAVNPNTWACYTVEGLLENGIIAPNPTFRPEARITKSEALGMAVKAACGDDYMYDPSSSMIWQEQLGAYATAEGIATFSDYTVAATRGFAFEVWVNAMNACADMNDDDVDDVIDDVLDGVDNGNDDNNNNDDDDDNDNNNNDDDDNVVTGGTLEVTLSPETPMSNTLPGNANGVPVVKYDFTAGDTDVTISQITVKRSGLSDEDTIDQLAAFSERGRASNGRDDTQENDTEAQLNLSGGGLVVMAGETRTVTIVADLGAASVAENDEFAIELVEVQASADVQTSGTLRGNLMRVGSVDAPTITFMNGGSVSDPQLGEQGADIFEFEIEGADDDDVTVEVITFEGSWDAEDNLMNFELYQDNDLIASTEMMFDDYLTFVIDGGVEIEEDQTEDFTVKADVVEGAGETISFDIDEELDVTAQSQRLGVGAAVDIAQFDRATTEITIEAGELTLVEVDLGYDEIREDKDNVEIAKFEVFNAAGQNLELQDFGVLIELTNGWTPTSTGTLLSVFDEVELYSEDTWSTYDLDQPAMGSTVTSFVYSDDNIDAVIPQGTTTWSVRVDTEDDIANFDGMSFDISFDTGAGTSTTGSFRVEETEDDEEVTDITPSNISFDSLDGSLSSADIDIVNGGLADIDVVRGADDITALRFKVEADETSSLSIQDFDVAVAANGSGATSTIGTTRATRQQVTEIKLFADSANGELLDTKSGNDIGTNGVVTFDDMDDFMIDADEEQEFVVTLTFADSIDAVNGSDYKVALVDADIEDDENDDVNTDGQFQTAVSFLGNARSLIPLRDITVNDAGNISQLDLDDANDANEFDKLALAGEEVIIASYDVRADNEEIDVDNVVFTLSGSFTNATTTGALNQTVVGANLLLDGKVVATAEDDDVNTLGVASWSIVFEDLNGDLVLPTSTTELELELVTANIGEDFTGQNLTSLQVTSVVLSDLEGEESNEDLTNLDNTTNTELSRLVDVVAAVVTPTVDDTFGTDDQTAELRLVVDGGDNTDDDGNEVQAELAELNVVVSSFQDAWTIQVFNSNGDAVSAAIPVTANSPSGTPLNIPLTATDSIGDDDETYRIEATGEAVYRLARNGVVYTINDMNQTSTRLENTLSLGQYADSN